MSSAELAKELVEELREGARDEPRRGARKGACRSGAEGEKLQDLPGDASGKTDYPIIGVNLSN
jgi:hypothetical protein